MSEEINEMAEIPMDGTPVTYEGGSSIIQPGEYLFRIINLRKEMVEATAKMPKHMNMKFQLKLETADGPSGTAWDNIRMYRKWLWKYSELAKSIGHAAKDSTSILIHWDKFVGSEGRVKIDITDWKKSDGTVEKQNTFKYLLPAENPKEMPF